jgi:hypothetical protein
MLFCRDVLPYGPIFKALDFSLHLLPSAAFSATLPRCHAALTFVDLGVGFADRAVIVVSVGFSQNLWVLHISICITPENMSTFDPPCFYLCNLFIVSPKLLQSVQRHSAILLKVTNNGMQEIHPVIYILFKLSHD